MANLDVVSLFTKVPIYEVLSVSVVQNRLESDHKLEEHTSITIDILIEMLKFCVQITLFQLGSDI